MKVLHNKVVKHHRILKIQQLLKGDMNQAFKECYEQHNFKKGLTMLQRMEALSLGKQFALIDYEEGLQTVEKANINNSNDTNNKHNRALVTLEEGNFIECDSLMNSDDSSSDASIFVCSKVNARKPHVPQIIKDNSLD